MPSRVIAGQSTKLGRTMHAIHYDPIHDEVLVSNPFAQAILTFRGDAHGEVAPVRVLQGPNTGLDAPDRFSFDAMNGEIYVGQGPEVLIFPRLANGDVRPIRRLTGDWRVREMTIDAVHNLIIGTGAVGQDRRPGGGTILMFDRASNGNVAPKSFIRGPKTGLQSTRQIVSYPEKGLIYVSQTLEDDKYTPGAYFVGVFSINDSGDVAPRWRLGGPQSGLKRARGVAIDPKNKEILVADMLLNAVLVFYYPEIF